MAIKQIDRNRGSDLATGDEGAPWQNLSKLASYTPSPGDRIQLADDSEWDESDRVLLNGWNGTKGNPIIFERYNPNGGASVSYPIIRGRYVIPSGSWTWDAAKGAWWCAEPLGVTGGLPSVQGQGVLLLGSRREHGQYIRAFSSPNTPFEYDGQWGADTTNFRYYVKSPATQNPTQYFGEVIFGRPVNSRAPFLFNKCGSYVEFHEIKFAECGVGVLVGIYNTGGAGDVTGFRMVDCVGYNVGNLFREHADFVSGSFEYVAVDFEFIGNMIERNACAGFHLNNSRNPLFERNVGSGMTSRTWPIGYVYIDASDSPVVHPRTGGGEVRLNTFSSVAHGTELRGCDATFDGALIYTESGSAGIAVWGNRLSDTHTAVQNNGGRSDRNVICGNVIINCGRGVVISDASAIGTGGTYVLNNTMILDGGDDVMPAAEGQTGAARCAVYFDGTGSDSMMAKNNIILSRAGQTHCFKVNSGLSATYDANWLSGFASLQATIGGAALAVPAGSVTADPSPYINADGSLRVPYMLDGVPMLNQLGAAGVYVQGVRLMGGARLDPRRPVVGAFSEGRY